MSNLLTALSYQPVELDFGTSGLRGKVTDMTDLECYINVRGFLKFLQDSGALTDVASVSIAGDLRDSTPRILAAAAAAINDSGLTVEFGGYIPTPAIAYWAMAHGQPAIMVTGSHIPSDRNGIKFYKPDGEVLKSDEQAIKAAVASVRQESYESEGSAFTTEGMLANTITLPEVSGQIKATYMSRYIGCLADRPLEGRQIVVYQHSAVGRDLLVELFTALGAETIAVDRSDVFIPIDTENVTPENREYFISLAEKYPDATAFVSTDGDSDRPFLIDETGTFHRGDVLGLVVSDYLQATMAIVPVSANDAVDRYLAYCGIPCVHTKIGSPYVIVAMQAGMKSGSKRVVGWEVNGGYLTGSDIPFGTGVLSALPTRDAVLPLLATILRAVDRGVKVSELFADLPKRFTQAGLIDNFPVSASQAILQMYAADTPVVREQLEVYLPETDGFSEISLIDTTDGIRITCQNGDIIHLRPSGNAPQMRVYSVSSSQERADEIVALSLAEPDGILRRIERSVTEN